MQRVACIDIGTVTVRLAVADVEGGRVQRLAKQSVICDLGEGLSSTGVICEGAKGRVLACIDGYRAAAAKAAAPAICCTLTSAARDAANSDELVGELASRGLSPQVIPGEVEGTLTFLGVAQDFPGAPILCADNGGGSTELALGRLAGATVELALVRSVDVGCRRVTERFLSARETGIPTREELAEAHAFAAELFAPVARCVREAGMRPERLVATGGTVTSLVAVDSGLVPYDSGRVHLHALTRVQVGCLERQMAALSVAERAQVPGLQPKRAPVILGGVVAIAELLRQTGFDRLTVSESDLLFGLSITAAAAMAGERSPVGWVPTLAGL